MPRKGDTRTLVMAAGRSSGSARARKCRLLVTSGQDEGREVTIDKDIFTVGADERSDLVLTDGTVSRHHCEFRVAPTGILLRDLGSTNGTFVRGVRVEEAHLQYETELQFGGATAIFSVEEGGWDYELSRNDAFGKLIGNSVVMRRVFHLAETYAPTDATVLIEGESGTGKDVLAEELHRHSKRSHRPFVVIDCAALAKDLIESELFGHVKGAFTGAAIERAGAFEFANGGTVFLDEVADLRPDLQPKLLRVLEKREIRRVGSNEVKPVDVRIVSATNRNLSAEVNAGRFREDLYYRLSVVTIEMPPLRSRKEDIPLLVEKFALALMGEAAAAKLPEFEKAAKSIYMHEWPGNVRELRNLVELACYSGKSTFELGRLLYRDSTRKRASGVENSDTRPFKDAKSELISDFEQHYIRRLLDKHGGNVSRAAQEARIERAYLQRLIKKYGIGGKGARGDDPSEDAEATGEEQSIEILAAGES